MKCVVRPFAKSGLMPAMAFILTVGLAATAAAQIGRQTREHTVLQSAGLNRQPATSQPPAPNAVTIEVVDGQRIITANGIPDHLIGTFPNSGNPNAVRPQSHRYVLNANPVETANRVEARGRAFGVAVNGVVFDPGAAEWFKGERGPWQYEPLSGAVPLGVDANNAHVQPDGSYHYHGLPVGLLNQLGVSRDKHSPLVGWAADGFPIYAQYGHVNPQDAASPIIEHRSGYVLKEGAREAVAGQRLRSETPTGFYDGTFVADYTYVPGHGTLDECNGIVTVTPEFPEGTYAYFLTTDWPVIPRCFASSPSKDFAKGPGNRGARPGGRPSGGGPGGGRPGGPPPQR